jgi:hypothetical protein
MNSTVLLEFLGGRSSQGRNVHDFRRTVVRRLEQAGIPRSVGMKLTEHKTESAYRRYAIVSQSDLEETARRFDSVAKITANKQAR